MSASISPDRITGALLLVNEVFGTHTPENAKRLHPSNWKDYVNKKEYRSLKESEFLVDAKKSKLLIETLDRVLGSINSRTARAARLRFGIDDGKFRTLGQVGQELDPGRVLTRERPRQLIAMCTRMLRNPTRNDHLKAFYGEKTVTELRAELKALPEPGQRRVKAP